MGSQFAIARFEPGELDIPIAVLFDKRPSRGGYPLSFRFIAQKALDGIGYSSRVRLDDQCVPAINNQFVHPREIGKNCGAAGCHRLPYGPW
jgi:hypothetical protein